MAEQIVCAFYATRHFLGNVCRELESNGLVEGSVVLKKLSAVDYNFEFILDSGFVTICADIDDFRLVESSKFQIVTEDQFVYAIDDRSDYLLFRDAVYECQLLMEVSYHFDLIKSNHFTKLSKALAIDNTAPRCGDYMALNYEEYQVQETISDPTKERYSDPLVILDGVRNIVCVFCKAEKVMEKNLTFALHPYVPMNFEKKNIYMCFRCLDNWRQFREEAICDDTLLPEDEINEDLCGICSVSASELFMCATCPRSFCGPCLEYTLTAQQVVQVKEPQDWICMCCTAQVSSITPSAMSSDWCIAVVEYAHLLSDDPYMIRQNSVCIQDSPHPVVCIEDDSAGAVENTVEISQHYDPASICPLLNISQKRVREMQQPFLDRLSSECNGDHMSSHDSNKVARKEVISKPIERVVKEVSQEKKKKFLKIDYPTEKAQNRCGSRNKNTSVLTAHGDIPIILLDYGVDHGQRCEDVSTVGRITGNAEIKNTEQATLPESIEEDKNVTTKEVVEAIDAVHYFTRYLQDLEMSSHKVQAVMSSKTKYPTDDVCFLCKDGGDLLECDYVHRDLPVRRPCQRVYHRHCLPFVVPPTSKNWKCPRHYCDFCGNSRLRYMCKYCPMSACAACSEPVNGKITIPSSAMECSIQFTDNIRLMTCDSCTIMIARCSRGQVEPHPTLGTSPSSSHPSKPPQSVACRSCKRSTKRNPGPRSGALIRSRED